MINAVTGRVIRETTSERANDGESLAARPFMKNAPEHLYGKKST